MSFFQSHNRSFKAEWIKMKHTGMLWLCFGAAIFIPLIVTLVMSFVNINNEESSNRWNEYIENNFGAFTAFFYPLFLILVMGRLVYLEHRSDTWKLLETQPVSRLGLYLVKFEMAALISLVCLIALLVFSLIGGTILQQTASKYGFSKSSIDWSLTLSVVLRFWIAGLAILSAQYFLGMLIKSFAWPLGIGLIATIAGGIFHGFEIFSWWPYSTTIKTSNSYFGSVVGNYLLPHEKLALLWTVVFLCAGYAFYSARTFRRAFIGTPVRIAASILTLAAFLFISSFINKPSTIGRYHKTILSGKVDDKVVKDVVLLKGPAFDTIAKIPVLKGRFKAEILASLPAGKYYVRAGQFRGEIFMGDKDSLFMELPIANKNKPLKVFGTRMAENQFGKMRIGESLYELADFPHLFTPQEYADNILSEWDKGIKALNDYTTSDQVKPSPDFLAIQRKLFAIKLITLTDFLYPRVFAVYHPNEELKMPSGLDRIRKEVELTDLTLISFPEYIGFVNEKIIREYGKTNYFAGLNQTINDPIVLQALTYDAILNQVLAVRDSTKREFLFASAIEEIKDQKLKEQLIFKAQILKNLKRGKKAGNISTLALNDSSFSLSDFNGRYIVIDFWATWCTPCVKEAPFFEELAERYTSPEIAFTSISVDEKKDSWRVAVAGKKTTVLQLWASKYDEELEKGYSIHTIPRFMLIDNRGNIINSEMPPPSDPEFEAILLREIPSLKNN